MEIVIRWNDSNEYIVINKGRKNRPLPVQSTREIWDDRTVVNYKTTGHVQDLGNGDWLLHIVYAHALNTEVPDFVEFGTSKITLKAGATKGKAEWHPEVPYEGSSNRWMVLSTETHKTSEVAQKHVRIIERNQQAFRALLRDLYGECALTGEKSIQALEAAHVIPSRDSGNETLANGILLRADLHRLYDAGEFRIDPKGKVILHPETSMSAAYKDSLANKSIPDEALRRTKRALALVAPKKSKSA